MKYIIACGIVLHTACDKKEATPSPIINFEGEQKVIVTGYTYYLMELFLSRDERHGHELRLENSL